MESAGLKNDGQNCRLGIPTRVSKNPGPGETRSFWQTRNPGLGRAFITDFATINAFR